MRATLAAVLLDLPPLGFFALAGLDAEEQNIHRHLKGMDTFPGEAILPFSFLHPFPKGSTLKYKTSLL